MSDTPLRFGPTAPPIGVQCPTLPAHAAISHQWAADALTLLHSRGILSRDELHVARARLASIVHDGVAQANARVGGGSAP